MTATATALVTLRPAAPTLVPESQPLSPQPILERGGKPPFTDRALGPKLTTVSERTMFDVMEEDRSEMFAFLDALRESGTVNMFASPQVLASMFEISAKDSRKIVAEWMENF
ncbi:hypothetical protein SCBWM1_gp31 [Synechococcus phage S-CBWM1]|uniref:Uncharacterized protein n=1 Tax=Synechococcus phage S-CBWM1 TaxID=2053653 RepID=A0A3G1L3F5_9CAUD|nr:hypothetical protein HOU61_gp166 [Synechococcus phage S-CBWM1]ATW62715.1 hypothetical protein SCBWM1_gp31 [Synechococcus phage S-CBWM1]